MGEMFAFKVSIVHRCGSVLLFRSHIPWAHAMAFSSQWPATITSIIIHSGERKREREGVGECKRGGGGLRAVNQPERGEEKRRGWWGWR